MANTDDKIELLKKIARRFNDAGITWALGASMMLYFKGIAPEFNDIDLMIADRDIERAKDILAAMGTMQPANPKPMYRTKAFIEFVIDSVDVDVMAGFSIIRDGKTYDCSLREDQIAEWMPLGGEKIPLQAPLLWREYYRLMGREKKVEMIEKAMAHAQTADGSES